MGDQDYCHVLLCPQNSNVSVEQEMQHVMSWAATNKMTINLLKTVELVFRRPSTTHDILPTELADVQRVSSAKLLGVVIRQDINFCQHIESVITTCNQRLYLLAQLRRQNLSVTKTENIFQAIILNKIIYALPVYVGYLARNISCNKYVTEPSTGL